jgi:putative ATP-dependent endonuclease of OLD family
MDIEKKYDANFSTKGVVIVNANGGDKIYTYAIKLKNLGYDVCVFADNDVSEELSKSMDAARQSSIPLFLCNKGNCLEKEIIMSISWDAFISLIKCDEEGFPNKNIELSDDLIKEITDAVSDEDKKNIREKILQKAIQKRHEWFKHIPGGEFLGMIVLNDFKNIPDGNNLKINLVKLKKWCGFGQD